MALSTRKKNIIIADWKAGRFKSAYALAKAHKVSDKTVTKIIKNIDSIMEKEKKIKKQTRVGFIYLMRAGDSEHYKIGITRGKLKTRQSSIQSGNHLEITITHFIHTNNILTKEKELHKMFEDNKTRREWFIFKNPNNVIIEFNKLEGR